MVWTLIKTLFLAALVLLALAVGYWQWSAHQRIATGTPSFVVNAGEGASTIARRLVANDIITEPYSFILWTYRRGYTTSIKAGEYRIDPDLTLLGLLEKLARGDVISYSITFVEGWTFKQFLAQLNTHPKIRHTIAGKPPAEIMSALGHAQLHPEGRFFPDTYVFSANAPDLEILEQAFDRMDAVLRREWDDRDPTVGLANADEALTLASIIEKETGKAQERETISAVFHNRLRRNMRLQTDPTVIYGLGDAFTGNLKRVHLRSDTPYNTYTRAGLPPTPIANPGAEAIRAALHPADTNVLYFVSRGDGSHQFSATLAEHNNAVVRYQLGGKKKSFSSSAGNAQ